MAKEPKKRKGDSRALRQPKKPLGGEDAKILLHLEKLPKVTERLIRESVVPPERRRIPFII